MTEYPTPIQVEMVELVDAALIVAAWQDSHTKEALISAAEYLDRQVASCRTESANLVLKSIAEHYKREASS